MSKGSIRRPTDENAVRANWDEIFGKGEDGTKGDGDMRENEKGEGHE